MITFSAVDVVTVEHTLRVDRSNRYGWLHEGASGHHWTSGISAVVRAVRTFIHRDTCAQVDERSATSDAAVAVTSHLHGTA